MELVEAIKSRKSIRAYKPTPVPKEIIAEILELAKRAPTCLNTQPWKVTVITGELIRKIAQGNREARAAAPMRRSTNLDVFPVWKPLSGNYPPYQEDYRRRQVDLGKQLFGLVGVAKGDTEALKKWREFAENYFDAPTAIIMHMERSMAMMWAHFDIALFMQTLCLAALNYGLGTCLADGGVHFPEVLRKYLPIPESDEILMFITIGYPDWDHPANKIYTPREPLEKFVTWCGFE